MIIEEIKKIIERMRNIEIETICPYFESDGFLDTCMVTGDQSPMSETFGHSCCFNDNFKECEKYHEQFKKDVRKEFRLSE